MLSGMGESGGKGFGGFGKSGGRGASSGLGGLLGGFGGTSQNDLAGNFACKKIALIFARGTTEPGNMGLLVGPNLARAMKQAYQNDVLVKGIDYPGMCSHM